ncbi:NAD(P)H-dependent oxidoreductase [Ancylomarina sp. 16SWW S1-10-2]|uniref:NAD(P)H-dependent oxidoreductase n=1 Tax=Ancylomarina sp. 16SWW S1-10-2 TaxID=2499681 RepID=UPI0012ADBB62|nr:NAD(P)H-dependent oxidoreductase [Ancylomarina sp. 16SWW S1-10-2]MRT92559.1 flavodoxin family protein [Ancylomarina sp. 16SWW S1-10-2]
MKHLIIYTHFNSNSFTKAITNKLVNEATSKGHEIKIIDLYAENFDPVLKASDMSPDIETPKDILAYQKLIKWADHYTVVYPLWWGQMPAILKGFIDRVFSNGVAFKYGEKGPEGLLKGRTARVIICTGSPDAYYTQSGMHDAQVRVNDAGLFGFCGIETKITFFGDVAMGTDELRKGYLEQVASLVP